MSDVAKVINKISKNTEGYLTPNTECNDPNGICLDVNTLKEKNLITCNDNSCSNKSSIKNQILKLLKENDCETQECLTKKLGLQLSKDNVHKPRGPIDNEWLDNFNIENTLQNFEIMFPQFKYYKCELSDFLIKGSRNKKNDENNITCDMPFMDDVKKCFGIVYNTAKTGQPGKHWVSMFIDYRTDGECSIEFFDSGGNDHYRLFSPTLQYFKKEISAKYPNLKVEIKYNAKQHQTGGSECGVYSLFFITSRINGIPYSHFNDKDYTFTDNEIQELRKLFFIDKSAN